MPRLIPFTDPDLGPFIEEAESRYAEREAAKAEGRVVSKRQPHEHAAAYRERSHLSRTGYFGYICGTAGECVKCGSREDLTADHVHQIVDGGTSALHNLQVLCRPCHDDKPVGVDYRPPGYEEELRRRFRSRPIGRVTYRPDPPAADSP